MGSVYPNPSPELPPPLGGLPDHASVLAELEKILASASFRTSPRLNVFLRYVVEHTLQGEGDQLKEYRLGIDVMGRQASYDPRTDPVVRVEARRLRGKLREYYDTEGREDPMRIDIPKGRYAATFAPVGFRDLPGAAGAEPEVRPNPDGPRVPASPLGAEATARSLGGSRRGKISITAALCTAAILTAWVIHHEPLQRSSPGTTEIESIAVLPLQNATSDPAEDYLADGITDDLITNLARLPGLRVLARGTAFHFRGKSSDPQQAGRDLRVGAVLTGKLLERGDTVTVQADLLDVATGHQLWSGQYNRRLADIHSMQKDFSHEIAMAVHPRLGVDQMARLAEEPAQNTEAYLLYLKGRYSWNKRTEAGFSQAIDYFNQAIEKDPSYAQAYAGVADGYMLLAEYLALPADAALPKAREAALKALELEETLGEAHASLGAISADQWQWQEAEKEMRRAIELEPSYATAHQWYAELLCEQGRYGEAMAEIKAAQQLDPLSPIISTQAARILLFAGQNDAAIEQLRKTLDVEPSFSVADFYLGKAYLRKGLPQQAVAELQKATREYRVSEWDAVLAYAYARAGNRSEARRILNRYLQYSKRAYVSWYGLAVLYMGLGDNNQAFSCLEKAYRQHDPRLREMKVDPFLESLHSDPRFADLLHRTGLL